MGFNASNEALLSIAIDFLWPNRSDEKPFKNAQTTLACSYNSSVTLFSGSVVMGSANRAGSATHRLTVSEASQVYNR